MTFDIMVIFLMQVFKHLESHSCLLLNNALQISYIDVEWSTFKVEVDCQLKLIVS